ncbi:MAG: hypothetical protein O3C21_09085, partial [Verrucomicrobia bacterium]|nr:hypothetical protein [Verrucomicrobiota bacterium]
LCALILYALADPCFSVANPGLSLYLGRVRLQILPDSQSYEVFPSNTTKSIVTPSFIQTQFQIITSKETLYEVIDEMQLVKKWDDAKTRADAYGLLLDKLETKEVRGTDLIDIEIFHTDPQEAAELANAIGQAYKNRRTEIETTRSNQALDMLNAQLILQEQKVEDARQKMIELMEKFNIVDISDPAEPSSDSPRTSTGPALADAVAATLEKERAVFDAKTQVATIWELDEELKAQWMLKADLLPDAAKNAYDESAPLEGQYALLVASGLASDAELLKLRNSIDAKQGILLKATADAMELLQAEVRIAELTLKSHQGMVDELKDMMMLERKSYATYQEAKSGYTSQRAILNDMHRALLEEKVDLSLPKNPINIHENAEPNEVPARPRVRRTMMLAAATNLLWCIPGGLIVMYFAMLYTTRQQRLAVHSDQIPEAIELDAEEVESSAPPYSKGDENW